MTLSLVTGKELAGRYVIDVPVGSGGYGTVWKASDKQLNRQVALKRLLKQGGVSDAQIKSRLLSEAQKHAQLVHTNIVQVYDVIECEGEHLIVMEYVDGPSFHTVLRDHARAGTQLPLDQAASILADVLAGVAFAHEKRTVHRDLSPSNILLTSTGIPKISDFGIAKIDDPQHVGDHGTTQGGTGNPGYMAPEQQRGERADLSSDLFTVGIIGYLLMTGRHPFAHPSGMFEISELLGDANFNPEPPRPAASLTASQQRLFREYAAVVMRLLNREKAGRFPSARAVIDALEAVIPFQECANCGERIAEHARFCMFCGHQVVSEESAKDAQIDQSQRISITRQAEEQDPDKLVEEGFRLSEKRLWEQAIAMYELAIKIDPKNQKALRNLGYVLNRRGRFEEAEAVLSAGLLLPSDTKSHEASLRYERAVARAERKEYEEAITDLDLAQKLLPFSIKSKYLRAQINMYRGSADDARQDAMDVLRRVPDHAGALRLIEQLNRR